MASAWLASTGAVVAPMVLSSDTCPSLPSDERHNSDAVYWIWVRHSGGPPLPLTLTLTLTLTPGMADPRNGGRSRLLKINGEVNRIELDTGPCRVQFSSAKIIRNSLKTYPTIQSMKLT